MRLHGVLYGRDFVHHLFVNGQTSGGVHNHEVKIMSLGICYTVESYLHGILITLLAVDRHSDLFAKHFQLVNGGGTVNVAGHEQRTFCLFALEFACQLT